jgi:NAD(P)H-hydrate repair Nnr-like enzyme with NAD(P)H-hydrate dehydratase domain
MSGVLGTFIKFQNNLDDIKEQNERAILSVVAASLVTRGAAGMAFKKRKLGLTTPEIIEEIPNFLLQFYDEINHKL